MQKMTGIPIFSLAAKKSFLFDFSGNFLFKLSSISTDNYF